MTKKLQRTLWNLRLKFAIWRVQFTATRYLKIQSKGNWDRMMRAAHGLSKIREQGSTVSVD